MLQIITVLLLFRRNVFYILGLKTINTKKNKETIMDRIKYINLVNRIREVKLSLVPVALIATIPYSWISDKIEAIEAKFH